jgi:hypothetical protein
MLMDRVPSHHVKIGNSAGQPPVAGERRAWWTAVALAGVRAA